MLLDERTEFCDATALNTGAAGIYLLGDVIDLTNIGRDIGVGQPLWCVIQVDTTATSGGAATGAFILASDAQAAIATDTTATEHFRTAAKAVATLTAGVNIAAIALPQGPPEYERYLGILQVTAVAAFTAGKINAFLTPDYARVKHYIDAVN